MTRKDFKAAMLRGLGRCIKAVRQDPENFALLVTNYMPEDAKLLEESVCTTATKTSAVWQ